MLIPINFLKTPFSIGNGNLTHLIQPYSYRPEEHQLTHFYRQLVLILETSFNPQDQRGRFMNIY